MRLTSQPGLRQLRAFHEVARSTSLARAALTLHISQPALSYLMDGLEGQLGLRLLDRSGRGTTLTPNGLIFARRVNRFWDQVTAAVRLMTSPIVEARIVPLVSRLKDGHLRCLLALYRDNATRNAAEGAGMTQQALLRRLRDFEHLLGVLIMRTGPIRTILTPVGEELARLLMLATGEVEAGLDEIGAPQLRHPNLRIGALVLSPRLLLAKALDELLVEQVERSAEIVEGSFEELAPMLRAGAIDVIFGAVRDPIPFDDLRAEAILDDPYVLVCRRDHPLTLLKRIRRRDIAKYDFIVPTAGIRRDVLDEFIKASGAAPPRQVHTSWLPSITAFVRCSNRLAILSRWHVDADRTADIVSLDSIRVSDAQRLIGLTTRSNWLPTPFQFACLENVRRALSERRTFGTSPITTVQRDGIDVILRDTPT